MLKDYLLKKFDLHVIMFDTKGAYTLSRIYFLDIVWVWEFKRHRVFLIPVGSMYDALTSILGSNYTPICICDIESSIKYGRGLCTNQHDNNHHTILSFLILFKCVFIMIPLHHT